MKTIPAPIKGRLVLNTHRKLIKEIFNVASVIGSGKLSRLRNEILAIDIARGIKISKGERVVIYGLGTITATFRKGRKNRLFGRGAHPDTYVLKIKPSPWLRGALKKLAITNPDPKTVFQCNPKYDANLHDKNAQAEAKAFLRKTGWKDVAVSVEPGDTPTDGVAEADTPEIPH